MKLHEYQSKSLFRSYQIPVPNGSVARSGEEAALIFHSLKSQNGCMVKAQVLAGGRGKSGGIQKVTSADQAKEVTARLLSQTLATHQTKGKALRIERCLIEEASAIDKEFYLAVTIDRSTGQTTLLVSDQGGMDIEEIAKRSPEKVLKFHFSVFNSPSAEEVTRCLIPLSLSPKVLSRLGEISLKLIRLFVEKDCSLCEINPLVITKSQEWLALDAKIVLDDNALFRHSDFEGLRNKEEDDEKEREAKLYHLSYVTMNGNIGCLVNGAGLAMATMDLIKLAGGEPANFLDVGGGSTVEQVREGFKIILKDKKVRAVFINIFGGIMKCDVIAQGIIDACSEVKLSVPLVVRLEGTRVEEGRLLLKQSQLKIVSCPTMQEAAREAVRLSRS